MEGILDSVKECLQYEPAFCAAVCPFRLDVRDFVEKIRRGAFQAAYRAYRNAVVFPGIVSALCDEKCKTVCPRRSVDGAISLRLLERAAVDNARSLEPDGFGMPPKEGSVAVVGGGISGLACALRLAVRKYRVTVFEKAPRPGGHLHGLLPSDVILAEISLQFRNEEYDLRLGTEVACLDDLDFDAVYVATGRGGRDFGLAPDPRGSFASGRPGVFLGGSLAGSDSMEALADGIRASLAVEGYLKVGSMRNDRPAFGTRLEMDISRIPPSDPVLPADGRAYTPEEAVREAKRCLRCSCDACVRSCDLMAFFRKYPKRIAEEVEVTIHPGTLDGNGTVATRLISTCNQCGICGEVCPKGIDVGQLLLRSHRAMREKGAMPWAFHDFFLRDMAFSNGPAWLARLPRGRGKASRLFFPGCRLGSSDPRYVLESYRYLLDDRPDTALALGCCGVPALWAGDDTLHREAVSGLREVWASFGKPEAVFACPTCRSQFAEHLPEIPGVFLYDLLAEGGGAPGRARDGGAAAPAGAPGDAPLETPAEAASVFDPCSSRGERGTREAVRRIARRAGYSLEELPAQADLPRCCSWGGQVQIAHPPYADYVASSRAAEGSLPYIAWCANCRDIFASKGKKAWHILDIAFGLNGPDRPSPTLTERRKNQAELRRRLLREFWGEGDTEGSGGEGMKLVMTPELRRKLSDSYILEADIETLIEQCEAGGRKVYDPDSRSYSAHLRIGKMTYWAEYRPREDGFELLNAWSHRMSIEGE